MEPLLNERVVIPESRQWHTSHIRISRSVSCTDQGWPI